jgi:L-cystine transport system permease protein
MPATLWLTFLPCVVGAAAGLLIAALRVYKIRFWAPLFGVLIPLIKAVPSILVMYMTWFLFSDTFNIVAEKAGWTVRSKDIDIIWVGIVSLTLTAISIISETFRGALLSIGSGQYEAAFSVGLTRSQTMRRVIIPQMLPVAWPLLCSNIITILKASSLVYLIGVMEMLNGCLLAATANYSYLPAYLGAAALYWMSSIVVEQCFRLAGKRFRVFHRGAV